MPPLFVDSVMTHVIQPHLDLPMSEEIKEVVSSTVQVLRNGTLSSFDQVDSHLRSGVLKRTGHFGNVSSGTSRNFSKLCHNAAAMFAGRKVEWLMKTLQDSASRVISQDWAGSVDTDESNIYKHYDGTTPSPEASVTDSQSGTASALNQVHNKSVPTHSQPRLDNPTAVRRTPRQGKLSQDVLPLKCTQCHQIFEGKYRRDHLRRHIKFGHGNHYINCYLCGIQLKDRSDNVAKHLRAWCPNRAKQTSLI
jgi:hypothetical protein